MSAHAIVSLECLQDLLQLHGCGVSITGLTYDAEARTLRLDLSGSGLDRLPDPSGQVCLKHRYHPPVLSSVMKLTIENKS